MDLGLDRHSIYGYCIIIPTNEQRVIVLLIGKLSEQPVIIAFFLAVLVKRSPPSSFPRSSDRRGYATQTRSARGPAVARLHPPFGVSPNEAVAAIHHVLISIGDSCPECLNW